jgi:hypothetical protein
MTKFLLLYSGGGMPETEEQQAAVTAAWGAWYEALGANIVDGGNPTSMAKTVSSDGSVSDGVSGTPVSGYTIISADTLAAAAEMAKGCPVLTDGGTVAVYETFDVM